MLKNLHQPITESKHSGLKKKQKTKNMSWTFPNTGGDPVQQVCAASFHTASLSQDCKLKRLGDSLESTPTVGTMCSIIKVIFIKGQVPN